MYIVNDKYIYSLHKLRLEWVNSAGISKILP